MAVLALAASVLSAQSVTDWGVVKALAPGTQVRVQGARKVTGRVQSASEEAIVVRSGAREEQVARAQVARIAVKKRSHRGRNTLIGLGVGAGAGLGLGLAERCTGNCFSVIPNGAIVGAGVTAGAVLGTVIGAVIPTGGWREIYRSPGKTP